MSVALLAQEVRQHDEKHAAAHRRLRQDFTGHMNEQAAELDALRLDLRMDHELLVKREGQMERRKELSATHAVMLAAAIGGGFRLVEVVVTEVLRLLHP